MLGIFRSIARGVESTVEEKEWVAGVIVDISQENSYIRAIVRREMSVLQFKVPNIPHTMVQDMSRVLGGYVSKSCLDDEIAMYI